MLNNNIMSNAKFDKSIMEKAKRWLDGNYDQETKNKIRVMIENDPQELVESFYKDLEFGTGGLRGIMGVGSNRMNKYTVGMATQGLVNYLKKKFPDVDKIKVAVAHDSRNNSRYFAKITAEVLSANDVRVYLFDDLRPVPELSFAVRYYKCQSGIVITASHNPKEYNGYKVYWDDGGQLINPHDVNVIEEVKKISDVGEISFKGKKENIRVIGEEIDKAYLNKIKEQSLSPDIITKHKDLLLVYTPLHGTGYKLIPEALKLFGFENIHLVDEQSVPDGDFPTVFSPNPEEPKALEMALKKAGEVDADLVMATDPDADRVGIAVRNPEGKYVLLNGNQAATLLLYYVLDQWKRKGKITGKEYIVKTIVTSELLADIANKYHVKYFDVLTGFKYIADKIKQYEGELQYIAGGEESYGYMIGDFVRDKDAVSSCAMLAETAAWAAEMGKTLYEVLIEIYIEFAFYKERLYSVVRKGKKGEEEIQEMMRRFRNNPPNKINQSKVIRIKDYLKRTDKNLLTGEEESIELPKSNVLQFFLEDGSKISMRPSGTEPKIKFYLGVKGEVKSIDEYEKVNNQLEKKIDNIISDLDL